jgi:hypothetical protein
LALKAIASRCNRCDLPTEIFGLRDDDRFFGTDWGTPERTRTGDDAFEQIVAGHPPPVPDMAGLAFGPQPELNDRPGAAGDADGHQTDRR